MKNKIFKLLITTLLINCFFAFITLSAQEISTKQAKEAWAKLNLYKKEEEHLQRIAKFTPEAYEVHRKYLRKLNKIIDSSKQTLEANKKFDESWTNQKMWEKYASNLKEGDEILNDVKDQKNTLIRYAKQKDIK